MWPHFNCLPSQAVLVLHLSSSQKHKILVQIITLYFPLKSLQCMLDHVLSLSLSHRQNFEVCYALFSFFRYCKHQSYFKAGITCFENFLRWGAILYFPVVDFASSNLTLKGGITCVANLFFLNFCISFLTNVLRQFKKGTQTCC